MDLWRHKTVRLALLGVWVFAMGLGIRILLRYSHTPGAAARPHADWPREASIKPLPGRSTLLVFVHPQCPCSRATIGELARIIAAARDRVQTAVFFYVPPDSKEDWAHTDLWTSAASIPHVQVTADTDGNNARQFGARTSGQTLLYDRNGKLTFSGGITAARGHSGDNDGSDSIVALLLGKTPRRHATPVFGCALFGDTAETLDER
jgi:hypothetical protein